MNSKLQSMLYLLIQEMLEATEEERLEVINLIRGEFCDGCGRMGTGCQCQNDE